MASTRKVTKARRKYKREKLANARSKKVRASQRKLKKQGAVTV